MLRKDLEDALNDPRKKRDLTPFHSFMLASGMASRSRGSDTISNEQQKLEEKEHVQSFALVEKVTIQVLVEIVLVRGSNILNVPIAPRMLITLGHLEPIVIVCSEVQVSNQYLLMTTSFHHKILKLCIFEAATRKVDKQSIHCLGEPAIMFHNFIRPSLKDYKSKRNVVANPHLR